MFTFLFKKGFLPNYPFKHVLVCQAENNKARYLGKMVRTLNFTLTVCLLIQEGHTCSLFSKPGQRQVLYCVVRMGWCIPKSFEKPCANYLVTLWVNLMIWY